MNIYKKIGDLQYKQILLFQGPMGSFFDRLDQEFQNRGANTFRIGLNAGDEYFANGSHYTPYIDQKENFKKFIISYYQEYWIDMVFVFGDCRYYQSIAIDIAKSMGIKVYVFEEGYIRPDFITLEEDGVNANSNIPQNRDFYDALEVCEDDFKLKHFGSTYFKMAFESTIYYIISYLFNYKYPNYEHHRNFNPWVEAFYGIRSWIRKFKYRFSEKNLISKYEYDISDKYFFVPLQTHGDFQILKHSKYNNIKEFITEVLESFAKYSKVDDYLVFKHHPVDRGRCDYSDFIALLAQKLGCQDRVDVVYDLHLPTLLKHAKGTVVVNSTVGLSSLYHHTPTLCMGDAIYDIEGLTSQYSLDKFWINNTKVDEVLFIKYRYWLIKNTQINDNFYS
jgi:capsular polysaccharide export protein